LTIATLICSAVLAASCASPGTSSAPTVAEAPPELVFPPPPEQARFVFERTILGSADVVSVDNETRWRRVLTGEAKTTTGFSKPFDVEACQGRIYVSDTVRRSIMMFDVPKGTFSEFGTTEPGELRKPLGMAVDQDCNIYVVDGTARRVIVYDQDGEFLSAFGGVDLFERPSHVDVDADARYAYVVDTGGVGSQQHRVRVFDIATGEHVLDIGERGAGPGQFNLPRDVAVGRDGRIYVVDGANFRVQVFESDGTFVSTFGEIGVYPGQFSRPKGAAVDPDGNVYVTDTAFGNFQIFNPQGELLLFVGNRSETMEPARYMLPAGIGVDEDGRVYMVDQFFRKVDVFRPAAIGPGEGFLGARAAGP
jgi:DNA-binding beta-propeller fold protein YncE